MLHATTCEVKGASYKRPPMIVQFHLYKMFRVGKSRDRKQISGCGGWET